MLPVRPALVKVSPTHTEFLFLEAVESNFSIVVMLPTGKLRWTLHLFIERGTAEAGIDYAELAECACRH